MQNGVINRPERVQAQTGWHRDLNYQHWVPSKPLAVSALVCLEDFNVETGGTAFLPSSHKFEAFPRATGDPFPARTKCAGWLDFVFRCHDLPSRWHQPINRISPGDQSRHRCSHFGSTNQYSFNAW